MSKLLQQQIPKRLQNNSLFATFYALNSREKRVLLLAKNLQFFEVISREIIFAIDLSDTILKGLDFSNYIERGREGGQTFESSGTERTTNSSNIIKFGKYIYTQGSIKRLFILINVFDKLVVLERCFNGFKLTEQYENVVNFEIIDPDESFRPKVSIQCNNGSSIKTTFINDDSNYEHIPSDLNNLGGNEVLKALLEKVNSAKTELSVHKLVTKKEFVNFKNTLMFGPNCVRSTNLEEKQQLGKYGDVWMKLFRDFLIIGIPVINNCSQKPTTLQNIRIALICPETESIEFEYNLYQLRDDSFTYEKFDELLESEDQLTNTFEFNKEWLPVKTQLLHPECSGVAVLRMKWDIDLSSQAHTYLCFILYDIIRNEKTFSQQYHVQDIIIEPDILLKDELQVSFAPNALYQDLLAVTCTSFHKELRIEFESDDFLMVFCNFLKNKLGFSCIHKKEETIEPMDLGESSYQLHVDISNSETPIEEMYLHKENSASHWYGTLLRLHTSVKNSISVKLYTRSEEKVLALTQLLYKEISKECKILPKSCTSEHSGMRLRHFEDTLRKELQLTTKFCQENANNKELKRSKIYKFQQELIARELETDLAAMDIL